LTRNEVRRKDDRSSFIGYEARFDARSSIIDVGKIINLTPSFPFRVNPFRVNPSPYSRRGGVKGRGK
jgi:hypothetical protein